MKLVSEFLGKGVLFHLSEDDFFTLFLLFFLRELVLDDEGGEKPDAHPRGDNEPEVDVVLGREGEQGIQNGTEADAEEDAS